MAKSVEAKDDREDNLFKKYARSMPVREATSNNKLTLTARSLELIYTKENWPPGIESGDDFPAGSGSLKARGSNDKEIIHNHDFEGFIKLLSSI